MKMPARTGREDLVGREARVVSGSKPERGRNYLVRVDGELWTARSDAALHAGDSVVIMSVRGNVLLVKPKADVG